MFTAIRRASSRVSSLAALYRRRSDRVNLSQYGN